MDELLTYIIGLLSGDSVMQSLFVAAGGSNDGAFVVAPRQRALVGYPRLVVDGEEGEQEAFSDDDPPELLRGRLTLEIVTRQSDACPKPLGTLRAFQTRAMQLMKGDSAANIAPVKGQIVGDPNVEGGRLWNITEFRQINPTRMLPVTDPAFCRHLTTFDVGLYRLEADS